MTKEEILERITHTIDAPRGTYRPFVDAEKLAELLAEMMEKLPHGETYTPDVGPHNTAQ